MENTEHVTFQRKITEKQYHVASTWCQKNQELEITKNDNLDLVRITLSYSAFELWSDSQFPNPKSSESSFRCCIHLSLKATKSTHINHLLIFGMFSLNGRFFFFGTKKVAPKKNSSQRLHVKSPQSKINRLGAWDLPVCQDFWSDNLQPLSFSWNTKHPLRQTPKALSTPKREKSWPFHSAKPVWYWSTSCYVTILVKLGKR